LSGNARPVRSLERVRRQREAESGVLRPSFESSRPAAQRGPGQIFCLLGLAAIPLEAGEYPAASAAYLDAGPVAPLMDPRGPGPESVRAMVRLRAGASLAIPAQATDAPHSRPTRCSSRGRCRAAGARSSRAAADRRWMGTLRSVSRLRQRMAIAELCSCGSGRDAKGAGRKRSRRALAAIPFALAGGESALYSSEHPATSYLMLAARLGADLGASGKSRGLPLAYSVSPAIDQLSGTTVDEEAFPRSSSRRVALRPG
jgi:hypothetical protein